MDTMLKTKFYTSGLLKVSINVEHTVLTVHVHKARHLNHRGSDPCCSFVQISLHPDAKSIFETQAIPHSTSPTFNEKFSHVLKPEDLSKRLIMSVYNKDSVKGCNELIGCMSFGIKSLLAKKKKVDGCFHLMSEHLGQRKHIQAKRESAEKKTAEQQQVIPEMNKCLPQDQVTTVLLKKGSHGYGFTVKGSCPVRIGRVKTEGAACQQGLHRGDFIVRINGQNISRSSAESIARIVRLAEEQIELDVYCPHDNSESPLDISTEGTELDKAMLAAPDGASMSCSFEENVSPCKTTKVSFTSVASNKSPSVVHSTSRASKCSHKSKSSKRSHKQHQQLNCTVWNPDLSIIPHHDDQMTSGHSVVSEEVSLQEARLAAIDSLVECEQEFVQQMHQGIQWFSRPFRHCVLMAEEHCVLFQNIEKLVAISEFHITQLLDSCMNDSDDIASSGAVGKAYESRAHMLCEAYDVYAEGFARAMTLLNDLKTTQKFQIYMRQMEGLQNQMSLEHFIQWPLKHIVDLCESLAHVLSCTSPNHDDYDSLAKVTQGLKKTCVYIRDHLVKMKNPHSSSSTGSSSNSSCNTTSRSYSKVIQRSRTSFTSLDGTVDPELMELQKLLVFMDGVESIQFAVPNRHLIYAGELYMTHAASTFYVILLSDVLLLTQQKGRHLVVVDDPIHLCDVVALDSDSPQSAEFTLTVRHGNALKELALSSATTHEKHTWLNLLEEHLPTTTFATTTTTTTTATTSLMMSSAFSTFTTTNNTTTFTTLMSSPMNSFSDLSTSTIVV